MTAAPTLADVKFLLQRHIEALAQELAPDGYRSGRYWMARNPTRADKKPGSFWIALSGTAPGAWRDEATGEKGDVLSLVKYLKGFQSLGEALAWSRSWLGLEKGSMPEGDLTKLRAEAAKRDAERDAQEAVRLEKARKDAFALWLGASKDLGGTAVELYLEGRGIKLDALARMPGAIRAMASGWHTETESSWPVMIAAMSLEGLSVAAVHRTFLAADGSGKAPVAPQKKIWPRFTGAAIRLARGETDKTPEGAAKAGKRDRLVLCEGIEDGLSVAIADPSLRVWAAGTLGNLGAQKIPDCALEVIVCADNDWGKPQAEAALKKAIEALAAQGRPVRVARASVGKDFNDQLRGKAA